MATDALQQMVGERGIGVQVAGDSNTVIVYAGAAELHLVPKHKRRAGRLETELHLLRVDLRATTLLGRDAELAALDAWVGSPRPISARCITGRAGTGKTRLAIEICERAGDDWTAGFAQYGQFQEFVKRAAGWRWNKPILVVVDYAAALSRELRTWLEILARPEVQRDGAKLRLLLLERHADPDLGWWADLMRTTSLSEPSPAELADPLEPVALSSLAAVEDRRDLLGQAMRLAGEIEGVEPIPLPPAPGKDAVFDRRLADDTINNEPLYLMMAGAEAIRSGAPAALALSRTDLAERVADRERNRLKQLARVWQLPEKPVTHFAVCVTLQSGCRPEEALRLVSDEQLGMSFPPAASAEDVVTRLAEAMPAPTGPGIDAIRPDLIGEAYLLQGMREYRHFPDKQNAIVERAWQRSAGQVIATLMRTAQDFAHGEARHPAVDWLGYLLAKTTNLADAIGFAADIPEHTLALRELAVTANERVVKTLEHLAKTDTPETDATWRPALASFLRGLAHRLNQVGRVEPALAAGQRAVDILTMLAEADPASFRGELALALTDLSNTLGAVGRGADALTAVEQGVALLRELGQENPETYRKSLAVALDNLGNRLDALGKRAESLEPRLEALELRRALAERDPEAFRAELSHSLYNVSYTTGELGRWESALGLANEALDMRRELAARAPDAFRPEFAAALHNYANILRGCIRPAEALPFIDQAIAIRRELARQRPEAFRQELAVSLALRADCLNLLNRVEEALAANAEAINALSWQFRKRPATCSRWMQLMVFQHTILRRRIGKQPDNALVGEILQRLESLRPPDSPTGRDRT
jgi:tetratricopeptide (TPR) repeat protein